MKNNRGVMRRVRITKIDEIIDLLESLESTDCNYAETQRTHAIACLKNYTAELRSRDTKTVKIKEER